MDELVLQNVFSVFFEIIIFSSLNVINYIVWMNLSLLSCCFYHLGYLFCICRIYFSLCTPFLISRQLVNYFFIFYFTSSFSFLANFVPAFLLDESSMLEFYYILSF